MYNMIGHIFGGLDTHERRITELERTVVRKKAFGLGTVAKSILTSAGLFIGVQMMRRVLYLSDRVAKLEAVVDDQKEKLESALVEEEAEE